jgi:hypothetical protein
VTGNASAYPLTILDYVIVEQKGWDLGYPQGLYLQQLAFNMASPAFQKSPLQERGFQGLPPTVSKLAFPCCMHCSSIGIPSSWPPHAAHLSSTSFICKLIVS